MTGDRWTLHLTKGDQSPVKRYTLTGRSLKRGVLASGLAVVALVALVVTLGVDGAARVELHQLRERNRLLGQELDRVQGQVTRLESTVDRLAEKDAELRTLAGVDVLDPDVLEAGVGGPGLATPESHPLFPLDSALGEEAFALRYDLNALERRARILAESFDLVGDSLAAHRDLLLATPSLMPTAGYLSSRYSRSRMHPIYNEALPHPGVDISAPRGTPIRASADGRVVRAGWLGGYGNAVEIDHGFGYVTLYGHASKLLVRSGQRVERGDIIGLVGRTGTATSTHLHYEVRLNGRHQNPMNYVLPGSLP